MVLENFSLEVPQGGIYGLLGKNGAGKSTLLYLVAGLLDPQSGEVTYKDKITRRRRPSTLNDIFLVPEEFSLPNITLRKFIKLNARFYPNFNIDDLKANLETFELDDHIHLGALSMGQKKKVFLSFALACNTSLLLLDEPTNGLDIPGKSQFRKFIVSSINDSRTIVISTHQVRDIDKILDHIIITDNKKVLLNNTVHEIISHLKFIDTDSQAVAAEALYSQPSIMGYNVILPNKGDEEDTLNIETLFNFALHAPDKIQSIFKTNTHQI